MSSLQLNNDFLKDFAELVEAKSFTVKAGPSGEFNLAILNTLVRLVWGQKALEPVQAQILTGSADRDERFICIRRQ